MAQAQEYGKRFLKIGPLQVSKVGEDSLGIVYALSTEVKNTGSDTCSEITLSYSGPEQWWFYKVSVR